MIELASNIGAVGFKLSVEPLGSEAALKAMAGAALKQGLYHGVPGEAFKKSSGFKRDGVYGEGQRDQVLAAIRSVLSPMFEVVNLEGFAHVEKESAAAKAVREERAKSYAALVNAKCEELAAQLYPECAPKAKASEAEESEETGAN